MLIQSDRQNGLSLQLAPNLYHVKKHHFEYAKPERSLLSFAGLARAAAMKALTGGVSASLRQSATINQGGDAGCSFRNFQARSRRAPHAARREGKFVTGRDSGNQAGPAVVLAADARLATDGGEQLFEMYVVAGIIFASICRDWFRRHLL
jgi:hypothetical protein